MGHGAVEAEMPDKVISTTHKMSHPTAELTHCTVCEGAYRSLPKECPGVVMTTEQHRAVWDRQLDYYDGAWWAGKGD